MMRPLPVDFVSPADSASAVLSQPSRDEGQEWAREELSDPAYDEADITLFGRIGQAIQDFLNDIFSGVSNIEAPWLTIVVVAAVVALILVVIWWTRRSAGVRLEPHPAVQPVFRSQMDPVALRRAAADAAAAEDWRLAVQELVRAVFAEQTRADLITIDRSSTAQELAAAAGGALPHTSGQFRALAVAFDEVTFSGGSVERFTWDRAQSLDHEISTGAGRATGPGASAAGPAAPTSASGPASEPATGSDR